MSIIPEKVLSKIEKAKNNSHQFQKAYNYDNCYRNSNQIDRLMNYQDRLLFNIQYFHGNLTSARLFVRAMSLLWNFHPFSQRASPESRKEKSDTAFERLNHFSYSHNWLENLLIASSMNGYRPTT